MLDGWQRCVEETLLAAVEQVTATERDITVKVTVAQPAGSVTVVASARAPRVLQASTGTLPFGCVVGAGSAGLPVGSRRSRGSSRRSPAAPQSAAWPSARAPSAAPPVPQPMAVDQEGGQRAESNRRAKRRLLLERRWRTRKLAALGRIYYSSSLRSFVRARRSRWAAAAAARRVVVAAAPVVAAAAASGGSSTVVVRTPGVQPLPSALGPRCASQLEGASQPSARRVRPSAEGRASARFSETLTHKLTALRDMLVARGCPPVEAGRATDARVYEGWDLHCVQIVLDKIAGGEPWRDVIPVWVLDGLPHGAGSP